MTKDVPTAFTKGIDRTVGPLLADKGSLYVLRNLRHSFDQRGVLVQTPYWYDFQSFSQGTYYNGGNQTEPTSSAIRLVTEDLVVTDYVCRGSSGQLQTFYQTTVPAAEGVTKGCRLVINSVTGLGINLGATLEVEIEAGGVTFQWRKNGGAWTTAVGITTAGVSIDGGNATLYFLTASGFTSGDDFIWTRLDRSWAATGTFEYPCEFEYYKGELYFNSVDDRIMVCSNSTTGKYVISVGYRPVIGSYLTFFDDHLVVTWFRKDTSGWNSGTARWNVIGWSDKTDIHNFIPTDTNEADQYALPNNNKFDTVGSSPDSFLMGVLVQQGQLYAFTNNEVYWTSALGLPIVFSFQKLMNVKLISSYSAVIRADQGAYVIGHNDVFFFDGNGLRSIGAPVIQGTDNSDFEGSFGCWDPFRKELNIVLGTLLFVYQAKWDTWYVRSVDFNNATQPVTAINSYPGDMVVGIKDLKLRREDTAGTSAPIFDGTDGTVYMEPYLVTQIYGDNLAQVKELLGVYFGGIVSSTGVSSTHYTTGSSITVQLSYWLTPGGDFFGVSETTPTGATWTSASLDGFVSNVRTPFRGIAIGVEVQGTVSKPPAFIFINQLVPSIYNALEEEPSR